MKKILSSLIAATAVVGFASAASASQPPTTSAIAQSGTSIHTGAVTALCELQVLDGTLPSSTTALVTQLTSASKGKILTRCNKEGVTLSVKLDTHVSGTDDPGFQTLVRQFELSGGTLAYAAVVPNPYPASTVASPVETFTGVNHAYSTTASTLNIEARVIAPTGQNLAAGGYTVRAVATLTP
jgi:hypothetical protein